MKQKLLWIDDYRDPFDKNSDWLIFSPINRYNCEVIWVKNYQEAINYLNENWVEAICFDHDLGEEKTGYDIAKWVINQCLNGKPLPKFNIQSANPVGAENIRSLFKNYIKYEK